MPKLDEQISTLQQKLQQLKLRQLRIDARKRAVSGLRERKADTRRKILLGGLILEKLRHGELDPSLVNRWLEQSLTRDADRALFDLPARAVSPSALTSGTSPPAETEPPPRLEDDDGNGVG